MKRVLDFKSLYVFGYLHEIFHYLPARAFGLRAELHPTYVLHERDIPDWQQTIITLGPAFVDCILIMACMLALIGAETPGGKRIWAGWVIVSIVWLGTCLRDFRSIYHRLKHGRWLEE